jgi:HSP20 family protein
MVEKSHTAGTNMAGWYPSILGPLQGIGQHIAAFFSPQSDAAATEEHYEIKLELPGVSLDDIKIEIHDNNLTVQGEKRTEREEKGKTYFFSERTFGAFQRSFRLPPNVAADKIAADFKDGVLAIHVPKAGTAPETSRHINITQHPD